MIYKFKTLVQKGLSDTHTPVELYLKLRDKFANCFLLESSEYKSKQNSYSYICLQPLASFCSYAQHTSVLYPDASENTFANADVNIAEALHSFTRVFETEKLDLGFVSSGLFGYTSYDAIPLFDDIAFEKQTFEQALIQYHFFRILIVFNHFNNELYLIEHLQEGETSQMHTVSEIISKRAVSHFGFQAEEAETSNFSDLDFLQAIERGRQHCLIGDVFQVVLARKYRKKFKGDEFNLYRALRSVNPSSYLFYFDYGDFKIFGSSPEAQLTIKDNQAVIYPIAGTFKRSGDKLEDLRLAESLRQDPKENAEHVMLVDLARNDLSKNSQKVSVADYKSIEFYSHVIHMVSKVTAQLEAQYNPIAVFANSFPAGTLSGAPKYKAMQIIDQNEPESRGFYGGAIGIIGFDGLFNHAIFIRSFLSQNNELTYQAGCGIVAKSNPQSEVCEVNNKLMALRKAIDLANTL